MNQPNRRHFVSSIALGGIAGIAGCIGDGNDDSRLDDSHEPESGDDERAGEITDVRGSATDIGSEKNAWSVVEVEFDVRGELEESVELVIQALPQKYTSPEFESEEPDDVRTLDKIQIVDGGGRPDDVQIELMDYWDDIPRVNEQAFRVRLGLELESRQGVTIKDVVERPLIAYTHRENGEESQNIDSMGNNHTWVEDGEQHFVFISHISTTSNRYEELPRIPFVVKHSISIEDMDSLEAIYEDDPIAWQDYLDTRSEGSLSGVRYLERPIFADIADAIQGVFERNNLTDDDDIIVRTAYNLINSTTSYAQPWDTVSESVRVPYPELFFRDGEGDCKAQGFAANGILHHLGYDTSLFLFRMSDAPPTAYHHLSGGVGIDLDPETSHIGERVESGVGRDSNWRRPEFTETDERSADHISIDPSTASIAAYSSNQTAATYHFVEGK
ncbi:hypothetical protein JCM18237_12570 [Halorubrum luteum]